MDAQRYRATITHETFEADGTKVSGPWTRTVTMWGTSADDAKAKVERWARREFHERGKTVVAHATDVHLVASES